MIPTLLILGFAAGFLPRRWAIAAVVLLAIGWMALVMSDRPLSDIDTALGAAGLGLANATVGALAGQAIRATIALTREG